MLRSNQAPKAVVMVRPSRFRSNPETAADNSFQTMHSQSRGREIADAAYQEVTDLVKTLRNNGVVVHLFEDDGSRDTPDSVFPNNWFSTHVGGHIAIYPMYTESRRRERRWDVIEQLKANYRVQDVIDYSGLEPDRMFLEGTGAMVLDHDERVAYTARSNRADPVILERFCTHFNYEPMVFDAADERGNIVYHTNVLMCIASEFALVGTNMITDSGRRKQVINRLRESGREVIELSNEQIGKFAGNAIELSSSQGRILAMSATGAATLTKQQRAQIERSATLLPLQVSTIELAGGSVRCMMAGVHLSKR